MNNLVTSRLGLTHGGNQFNAFQPSQNVQANSITFGTEQKQIADSVDIKKKNDKWTTRNYVDAFTVAAYATLIPAAIAMRVCKSKDLKNAEALLKNKAEKGVLTSKRESSIAVKEGKYDEGSKLFKFFSWCGDLCKNSKELTNNKVYGFGTLVVMPLVIMFSPIGKKDATPEDRFFTILRQPISFATLFTMQLTFDKIFKSLTKDLNQHGLLDGHKDKSGHEMYFSKKRIMQVLDGILDKDAAGNKVEKFKLNESMIHDKAKLKSVFSEDVVMHLFGDESNEFEKGKMKVAAPIPAKGNEFTKNQFIETIYDAIEKMGENPIEYKKNDLGKFIKDEAGNKIEVKNKIKTLQDFLKPYEKDFPKLNKELEHMAFAGARTRALKEISSIACNSIFSQALGVMMLNFLYGKMMKKYGEIKSRITPLPSKQPVVSGGAK